MAACRPRNPTLCLGGCPLLLLISRVGAANHSSECLRSIDFPLGMPSFIGRGLTFVCCKQSSSASTMIPSQSPSARLVVGWWGGQDSLSKRLYHQGETRLDDSRLNGRRSGDTRPHLQFACMRLSSLPLSSINKNTDAVYNNDVGLQHCCQLHALLVLAKSSTAGNWQVQIIRQERLS